ncbi:MAG: proline--tRNA ligase [Acidobacteria bacterium]|nr:proline--tRNA ligase [Acidobacteriota bacterium]
MATEKERFVTEITPKSEDFSRWYVDVVRKAELADYSPIKGCMVIQPYGFALWENIRDVLDKKLKETGHMNAYFPLFIPESFLKKEAEHVAGFAPQVAWVTAGGDEELEERLAVRPTSEAIICSMYAKWVKSWRDLPLLINQWANVVRWEKVTRLFLRTTEFLWQEGHTVHATEKEAEEEALKILEIYRRLAEDYLAIPVIPGVKTEGERFAGAVQTYTIEALMADGKALQAGTTHNLGQHFAKAFGIRFEDKDQKLKYAWQTSWGVSSRLIGALVMTHGDDSGLIIPPMVAPIHLVIVPIPASGWEERVLSKAEELEKTLKEAGFRVKADLRTTYSPGWKFSEWELKGVPMRLEVGPKDIEKNQVVLVRRDNREKIFIPQNEMIEKVGIILKEIQKDLFARALKFREENTHQVETYDEFKEVIKNKGGFIRAFWCGDSVCEEKVKEETTATIRCIPLSAPEEDGKCIRCGKQARKKVYFAKAY